MKEVMAIVRMNKINQTKRALSAAGITSMHAKDCLGRGKGLVEMIQLGGAEKEYEEKMNDLGNAGRLIPKRMISVVVPNKLVRKTIDVIMETNRTGKSGDGKIIVMPVTDSIRIRTGETGDGTLDE
ncbi:P-II family nitrogen regulator [Treponema zuelzerae]|uniref:P-II family nitrogen regulator n=1 Tax=Teretinema zuelzerae TaxID=156 RepID=A0AAE3JIG2_9SPIR|nr:P-II family nitrogen regulator [Teretinema zuelzerae]MCD1655152.1 P-II family nitrogen regulator [Teretinema zuelzerae]HPO03485.1 P-II family nitrogen regulator [Treponemataceae bacterium]